MLRNEQVRKDLDAADRVVSACWPYLLRDLIVVEIVKAREAEREACAQIADEHATHHANHGRMTDASLINLVADAIRNRKS